MKKKCPSLTEEPNITFSKVRSRNLYSLISPPSFDFNHEIVSESQFIPHSQGNACFNPKEIFKIRDFRPKKFVSQKKVVGIKGISDVKDPIRNLSELTTLENCRKAFDKIIEKDKKYGEALRMIKEVYEKELKGKESIKVEKKLTLKRSVLQKTEESDKLQPIPKELQKARSQSFLIGKPSLKLPVDVIKKKESLSTIDTAHKSPTGQVPELTLNHIVRSDFHKEFMSNYDAFSESWRLLIDNASK